jgi:hypothetical protein
MGVITVAAISSTMLWLKAENQTKVAQIATLRENDARIQTFGDED